MSATWFDDGVWEDVRWQALAAPLRAAVPVIAARLARYGDGGLTDRELCGGVLGGVRFAQLVAALTAWGWLARDSGGRLVRSGLLGGPAAPGKEVGDDGGARVAEGHVPAVCGADAGSGGPGPAGKTAGDACDVRAVLDATRRSLRGGLAASPGSGRDEGARAAGGADRAGTAAGLPPRRPRVPPWDRPKGEPEPEVRMCVRARASDSESESESESDSDLYKQNQSQNLIPIGISPTRARVTRLNGQVGGQRAAAYEKLRMAGYSAEVVEETVRRTGHVEPWKDNYFQAVARSVVKEFGAARETIGR